MKSASVVRTSSRVMMASVLIASLLVSGLLTEPEAAAAQVDKVLYFSFDDGPHPQHTRELLDLFDQYDGKATFFVVSDWVDRYPEIVVEAFDRGHSVQNHTQTHPRLTQLSSDEVRAELGDASETITRLTGVAPTCMRPPYRDTDNRIRAITQELGLAHEADYISTGDYRRPGVDTIVDVVKSRAQPGSVILLHDGPFSEDRQQSVEAARQLLEYYAGQGYRFEMMPRCARDGSPPDDGGPPDDDGPGSPPGDGSSRIMVRARGNSGGEDIELRVNGVAEQSWNSISQSFTDYTAAIAPGTTIDGLRIHFTNNGFHNGVNKNVQIDYVEVDGVRFQAEDPANESLGSWTSSTNCSQGYKSSDWINCNGWIDFAKTRGLVVGSGDSPSGDDPPVGDPPDDDPPDDGGGDSPDPPPNDDPPDPPAPGSAGDVVVRARGTTGTENIHLTINGATVAEWSSIATSLNNYRASLPGGTTVDSLRVHFTNNGFHNGANKNVQVDYVVVDGTRHESEDPANESLGSWTSATNCSQGYKSSDWINCNGWIDFAGARGTTIGTDGGGTNQAPVARPGNAQTVTDSDRDGVEIIELDGSGSHDPDGSIARYAWQLDGTTVATTPVAAVSLPVGTHTVTLVVTDNEGATGTESVSITVDAPTDPPSTGHVAIVVQARGTTGTEAIRLTVNGETVAEWQDISASMADYVVTIPAGTTIDELRVHFTNNGFHNGVNKNVQIDYVEVDGVRFQAEDPANESLGSWTASTGCSQGYKSSPWINCNGWIDYAGAAGRTV